MVMADSDDLMELGRQRMDGDALYAVADLDRRSVIANPDLFTSIVPGHGLLAALPGDASIAGHLAMHVIPIWTGRPSTHRLHRRMISVPADHYLFMHSTVYASVGDVGQLSREGVSTSGQ